MNHSSTSSTNETETSFEVRVLMKWLLGLCFFDISMTTATIIRDWELADLEKGFTRSRQDTLALTRPNPVARKEEDVFSTESFTSSTSTLNADKLMQLDTDLPDKKYGRILRNIRFTWFTVYRRLNTMIVLLNVAAIIVVGTVPALRHIFDNGQAVATACAANLTLAVLIRQELVINLLFAAFGKCPRSMPLRLRRLAAKIYHLGGVHSGAGIAATLWFAATNYPIFRAWSRNALHRLSTAILIITIILDVLLFAIVVLSYPKLRARYHNIWEGTHRFAGWTAVALFWAHTVLSTEAKWQKDPIGESFGKALAKNPIFWSLGIITLALALPWLRLKKVPVRATIMSDHAIRLHFGYTNVPLCSAPRFSDSPWTEWHAFAAIPEEDGVGFSCIVSAAGDWTRKAIAEPPKELWVKGVPVRGVMHVAPIFNKIVLVATGSGIGPVLSLLYARDLDVRIIWSTPDPLKYYSQDIVDQVLLADPHAVIINTSISARPNLLVEAYKLYIQSKAEAVFLISNPKVTRCVIYGLESRGVPAFAPIFDS